MPRYRSIEECAEEYIKYRDTTKVLWAIKTYLQTNSNLGRFMGVEQTFTLDSGAKVTPDLSLAYDGDRVGCLVELKWRISQSTARDELLDLKRYFDARQSWGTPSRKVDHNDVVMICHVADSDIVMNAVKDLLRTPDNDFLNREGLAIWSWNFGIPKGADSGADPEMRFRCIHGKTKNRELEKLIGQPGGIMIPPEIVASAGSYLFTKDKPPIQYTMGFLLMHILSSFQDYTHRTRVMQLELDMTDEIYNRAMSFFPGWREAESGTVQARKKWIREALDLIIRTKFRVTLPLPRTKRPIQEVICLRLEKLKGQEQGTGKRIRSLYVKPNGRTAKLQF